MNICDYNFLSKYIIPYCDLVALGFFILLIIYFNNKPNKTNMESFLSLCTIFAFMCDLYFTFIFIK